MADSLAWGEATSTARPSPPELSGSYRVQQAITVVAYLERPSRFAHQLRPLDGRPPCQRDGSPNTAQLLRPAVTALPWLCHVNRPLRSEEEGRSPLAGINGRIKRSCRHNAFPRTSNRGSGGCFPATTSTQVSLVKPVKPLPTTNSPGCSKPTRHRDHHLASDRCLACRW